jgi:hypothetical protein
VDWCPLPTACRLWALDQGKVEGRPAQPGSIKLAIYDSMSGNHIHTYQVPLLLFSVSSFLLLAAC